MKAAGALMQGTLAAAGLLVAYATWQREPVQGGMDAVILDVGKNQLVSVKYDEPARTVELLRAAQGGDDGVNVKITEKAPPPHPAVKAPDGGTMQVSTPPPPKVAPPRELRGSESASKLWEKFAPLRASRSLGVLAAEKIKELGLDDSKRTLEISAGGITTVYKIGTPSSGLSTPYALAADGKVYLLGPNALSEFEAAQFRLIERKFHGFGFNRPDELVVKAAGKEKAFNFAAEEFGNNAKLSAKGTPEKPEEFAQNWHQKAVQLGPSDFLGAGEVPATGAPQVALRLDYLTRAKPLGFLEVATSGPDFYARSERTVGWVKIAPPGDLLQEGKKIAAGN